MINKKYNNTLNDDIQSNNSSINENRKYLEMINQIIKMKIFSDKVW